jgi:hypothetical protein
MTDIDNYITDYVKKYVPSNFVDKTSTGIISSLTKHHFEVQPNSHKLFGSKKLADNSEETYFKHVKGLFCFLATIGDYDSLLVLFDRAPHEMVPSMNADSIALYMLYRTVSKGNPLNHIATNQPVIDVFGSSVSCKGDWKAIINVDQLLNAVSALHRTIHQTGSFRDICSQCVQALHLDEKATGCRSHLGSFLFVKRGNPRTSDVVTNTYKLCKDLLISHTVKSCYQLCPKEVHSIRKLLLSSNQLSDLQLYVMVLVAIFLFLRHDEVYNLKFDDYEPSLSMTHPNGRVSCLVFKVKGKSDTEYKYLVLWLCDEIPQFCPVRHLLIYLAMAKITSGYLFPNLAKRQERLTYGAFLKYIKKKLLHILIARVTITTHVFRKTGYLFGCWGGGALEELMESARHKTAKVAMGYFKDARTLKTFHEAENVAENAVPKWKACIIIQRENVSLIRGGCQEIPLTEVTSNYVAYMMLDVHNNTIGDIFDRCYETKTVNALEKLFLSEISEFSHEKQQKLCTLWHNAVAAKDGNLDQVNNEPHVVSSLQSIRGAPSQPQPTQMQPQINANIPPPATTNHSRKRGRNQRSTSNLDKQNKRKFGEEKLNFRHSILSILDPMEKLEKLLSLHEEASQKKKHLSESAKKFYYNCLNPVSKCFRKHYDSSKDDFLGKWNSLNIGLYTFNKTCCSGKGDCCTVVGDA